jgi:hypothetical protein
MKGVKLDHIFQTQIDDKANTELCLCLSDLLLAAADLKLSPSLADVDRWVDEGVRVGALASRDGKNSEHGFVKNHEKLAEIVGLKGVKKIYEKFDIGRVTALLQWEKAVELRDEGHHSLLCVSWREEGGEFYGEVLDPWPYTDDKRIDLKRGITQRLIKGEWKDSRSIEYIGYFEKVG